MHLRFASPAPMPGGFGLRLRAKRRSSNSCPQLFGSFKQAMRLRRHKLAIHQAHRRASRRATPLGIESHWSFASPAPKPGGFGLRLRAKRRRRALRLGAKRRRRALRLGAKRRRALRLGLKRRRAFSETLSSRRN